MKILVADDSPVFQTMLKTLLAKWGYDVLLVPDGEKAWEVLQDERGPQLAILDWFMPGIDGLEVCRKVRAANRHSYVYILLLTGQGQAGDVVKGMEAGADDYVAKPFNSEELRVRLNAGQRILKVADLERQVRERSEQLEERTRQLERSNKELEQFAYIASHDLQEPLRMVASYTQLLGRRYEGKLDEKADRYIAYAVDGAKRMQQLIIDLLAYSRVTTQAREFTPTNMEVVLQQALTNLKVAIVESGANVTYDKMPTVLAEPAQLVQVFQNLIGNSLKFRTDKIPHVDISAVDTGTEWVFSVHDNGIGLDPLQGERIFVMFQRLHTREEYPGTGIGLAICKKIVERHGGNIWVESQPGNGTTFHFSIPQKMAARPGDGKPANGNATDEAAPTPSTDNLALV